MSEDFSEVKSNDSDSNSNSNSNQNNSLERSSHRNFVYVNCENSIIGIHPVNPTFEYLHVANDCQHGKGLFCVSKRYGCFWLGNKGYSIHQSPRLQQKQSQLIFQCMNAEIDIQDFNGSKFLSTDCNEQQYLVEHIKKFRNIMYDETYGISGRLLLYCETIDNTFVMHQMFNHNELTPLYDELSKRDYVLMPGNAAKPFNLCVFVFEMLYGTDLIEQLVSSSVFNPAMMRQSSLPQRENDFALAPGNHTIEVPPNLYQIQHNNNNNDNNDNSNSNSNNDGNDGNNGNSIATSEEYVIVADGNNSDMDIEGEHSVESVD
jgi:hypothetical protein